MSDVQQGGETYIVNDYLAGADGTFEYPPAFRNYDQLKEFYSTARPSETTLRDFADAIRDHWIKVNDEEVARWVSSHPGTSQQEIVEAARHIVDSSRTPSSVQIAPLCRIRMMAETAQTLIPSENNRFWDDTVAIAGQRGGRMEDRTYGQFYDEYHLGDCDPDDYRARKELEQRQATAQTLALLTEQNELLRGLLSDSRVRTQTELFDRAGPR